MHIANLQKYEKRQKSNRKPKTGFFRESSKDKDREKIKITSNDSFTSILKSKSSERRHLSPSPELNSSYNNSVLALKKSSCNHIYPPRQSKINLETSFLKNRGTGTQTKICFTYYSPWFSQIFTFSFIFSFLKYISTKNQPRVFSLLLLGLLETSISCRFLLSLNLLSAMLSSNYFARIFYYIKSASSLRNYNLLTRLLISCLCLFLSFFRAPSATIRTFRVSLILLFYIRSVFAPPSCLSHIDDFNFFWFDLVFIIFWSYFLVFYWISLNLLKSTTSFISALHFALYFSNKSLRSCFRCWNTFFFSSSYFLSPITSLEFYFISSDIEFIMVSIRILLLLFPFFYSFISF